MSSNAFRARQHPSAVNNENPLKNVKNNLLSSRKQSALKPLTNTVQTCKKDDGRGQKQLKVLPMKNLDTENKIRSPFKNVNYDTNDGDFGHIGCTTKEKEFLPSSMTCNIGMLSNFFDSKNDDESDWFLEDYNNIMKSKIQKTFENSGEPDANHSLFALPPMPFMDFSESICLEF